MTVCPGFHLDNALQRAATATDILHDDDEAASASTEFWDEILDLDVPPQPPAAFTPALSNPTSDLPPDVSPTSSASSTPFPTSFVSAALSSVISIVSFSKKPPQISDPASPAASTSLPPPPPPPPPPVPRNQRTARRRRHVRNMTYEKQEAAMSDPVTRGPLSFPQRLVEKYGKINIADTLRMKWFSVPSLAHAVGAWVGLRKFKASTVEGWTAENLTKNCGFTLIEWDGTYVYFDVSVSSFLL